MVGSEVIEYIKEQIKAGYSPQEIKAALEQQGWNDQEIDEAFQKASPPQPAVFPPVEIKRQKGIDFFISIIAGFILFIVGLETFLNLPLISAPLAASGISLTILGIIQASLSGLSGIILLIFGLIAIIGSLMIYPEGKGRLGGLLVLVFSLLALIGFNGFLLFFGSILGILGGIVAIKKG